MITDALVNFIQPGAPLSLITGASTSVPSTLTYDILGVGVGVAPPSIIGTRTLFGQDSGIGVKKPLLDVAIGTAFVGSGASLNVQFQGAVDTGASGNYQPGTWLTLVETGAISVTNLTANSLIARFDFPPAYPAGTLPRFLRLNFSVTGGSGFTAGTIAFAVVTMDRDDWAAGYAAKNYTVA